MDSTSVQRLRPPPLPRRAARDGAAAPDDFPERVALFTAVFAPERAAGLLQQLALAAREEALRHAERIAALDPAARQGRVARAFGERPDAGERLRAVMAEAGPRLARALRERMPPHHRVLFPEAEDGLLSAQVPTELEASFASRLVKEATR